MQNTNHRRITFALVLALLLCGFGRDALAAGDKPSGTCQPVHLIKHIIEFRDAREVGLVEAAAICGSDPAPKEYWQCLYISLKPALRDLQAWEKKSADCRDGASSARQLINRLQGRAGQGNEEVPPFKNYQQGYCRQYMQIAPGELPDMIRELATTPYDPVDFLTKTGCQADSLYGGDVTEPLLQMTLDAPCSHGEFPEILHRYLTLHGDNATWLRAVNAKNTLGETYLDVIETMSRRDGIQSNTEEMRACVRRLADFACKAGGRYAVYSEKKCL